MFEQGCSVDASRLLEVGPPTKSTELSTFNSLARHTSIVTGASLADALKMRAIGSYYDNPLQNSGYGFCDPGYLRGSSWYFHMVAAPVYESDRRHYPLSHSSADAHR